MRAGFILSAAIVLDAVLFVANFLVALAGGSRVVFSQAVYNIADLVGIAMISWGYLASQRPPDVNHPFGYGKERFFWAFNATLVTFTLAGLGVFVTGIEQAIDPHPLSDLTLSLLVVGVSFAVSVVGVLTVLSELQRTNRTVQSFLESSQQSIKTVFYQDVVSSAGSAIAFFGLLVVARSGNAVLDGIFACGVGLMMLLTGFILAAESRALLVGKSLSRPEASHILAVVERDPRVRKVRGIQSMLLGPDDALVALRLNFQDGLTTDDLEHAIDQIAESVRREIPLVRHLIIEPES
jgi:cation diffusion facilitator family transporter